MLTRLLKLPAVQRAVLVVDYVASVLTEHATLVILVAVAGFALGMVVR